jgi:hypothetical protein
MKKASPTMLTVVFRGIGSAPIKRWLKVQQGARKRRGRAVAIPA